MKEGVVGGGRGVKKGVVWRRAWLEEGVVWRCGEVRG